MSERRRRSSNSGGGEQPPGRRPEAGRPYAYGSPVDGAPSYGQPGGPDELRSEAGGRRAARQTAQQPQLSRAEMRKQAQKKGRRGAASAPPGRGGKPGKKRFIDYPRFGKSGVRRWLPSWKQVLSVFLIFFGSGVATIGVAYAMTPVPVAKDLQGGQTNVYYWADGSEMTSKGDGSKRYVTISEISRPAQDAVIAAENETFRQDSGIDPKGIARAVYNMATGGDTQGGSTITQQFVKNAYLSQDQTLTRKLKEFFITLKLNGKKSKDDILEGYLNISWYGHGATGIQAAAQAYYGVDADKLDVCQGAMLAGLLKGAGLYDPTLSPANHDRMFGPSGRWQWILSRMVVTKAITQDQANQCISKGPPEPTATKKAAANMSGQLGYLVDTANKYLVSKGVQQAQIDRGGYKIYTTFDKAKVDALTASVNDVLGKNLDAKRRPATDQFVQVGATSVVPGDGAIVALYGGPGYDQNHYANNADTVGVPVGSTFKPIDLAAAMKYGVRTQKNADGKPTPISTDSKYLADDNAIIHNPDGTPVLGPDHKPFHQHNDEQGPQGYVTLKQAMEQSFNVPYVQLGEDVGGGTVSQMAQDLGLKKESLGDPATASFFIGTSTPSTIRMASAYSVFAAHGQKAEPYSVTKVEYRGQPVDGFKKVAPQSVLDPAIADNITDVLQNVVQGKNGTGTKAQALGRPVAGKTGTTDEYKSAWFDGYTPQLTTAVTMFREDPSNPTLLSLKGTAGLQGFYGGALPTEIFTEYMKAALANTQSQDFTAPQQTGTTVDQPGAASPSPSAPATTAPPTTAPTTTPSATAEPSMSTGAPTPTDVPSQPCVGLFCPPPTPTRTRPGKSPTPTPTAPTASPSP